MPNVQTASAAAPPRWFRPVAILALIWNLLGCAAYLSDVSLKPEDIAKMTQAQQALYASRPAWAVSATAFAVWGGAVGCLGLALGKRWATPVLFVSLAGVVVQDVALFGVSNAASQAGFAVFVLQGLVLAVAIALVVLGRRAARQHWLS